MLELLPKATVWEFRETSWSASVQRLGLEMSNYQGIAPLLEEEEVIQRGLNKLSNQKRKTQVKKSA